MASPKQLVECVAGLLSVPVATVTVHDRNLAMAGLRTVGGRGRAVAEVTATDAANLLLAVLGSIQVRDSVKTAQSFGSLVYRGFRETDIPTSILNRRHTLREGLAELINLTAKDRLRHADDFVIGLRLYLQNLKVEIDLTINGCDYEMVYNLMGAQTKKFDNGDLSTVQKLTEVTFYALGKTLLGTKSDG